MLKERQVLQEVACGERRCTVQLLEPPVHFHETPFERRFAQESLEEVEVQVDYGGIHSPSAKMSDERRNARRRFGRLINGRMDQKNVVAHASSSTHPSRSEP